ncbi:unnamed protein product, partial [Cylicocyclus nassatus]
MKPRLNESSWLFARRWNAHRTLQDEIAFEWRSLRAINCHVCDCTQSRTLCPSPRDGRFRRRDLVAQTTDFPGDEIAATKSWTLCPF